MARLHAVDTPLPSAKPMLRELASHYIRADGAEDWPQALMDLGSGVCTPRAPRCGVCPIAFACKGLAAGDPARLPTKAPKAEKPQRFGVAFALVSNGAVLVERRPDEGLLGGMRALPTTPWRASMWSPEEAMAHAPTATDWRRVGAVRHVFTHFALALEVYAATGSPGAGETAALDALQSAGLPTLFRKAAALVSF
jgi:A/G-specific adenine glycosylase